MKSLLISGISGKVGSQVLKFANKHSFNVICGVDRKTFSDADCPVYSDFSEVKENVDVIIDFSSPALFEQVIDFAKRRKCKLVTGTTALLTNQTVKLKQLSEYVAVCHSNNFSNAIFPFVWACEKLASTLKDFDRVLIEEHNKFKKDSPSGTAKMIAERLSISQIHAIRGGNVAGVHKIIFYGQDEEIEICHTVYNKSVFANGALKCAYELLGKEKGLFTVENLINND